MTWQKPIHPIVFSTGSDTGGTAAVGPAFLSEAHTPADRMRTTRPSVGIAKPDRPRLCGQVYLRQPGAPPLFLPIHLHGAGRSLAGQGAQPKHVLALQAGKSLADSGIEH